MSTIIIIRQRPRTSETAPYEPDIVETYEDAELEEAQAVIEQLIVERDA